MKNEQIKLRDHLNGNRNTVFERLEKGEDLSSTYPNETKVWNDFVKSGRNLKESAGISTKRLNS